MHLFNLLNRPSARLFLLALVITAFVIRLAAVIALRDVHSGPSVHFGADPVEFDALAWNVARGAGYVSETGQPTSFRAPGFPLFVSGLYAIAGRSYLLVYVTLCALGAVSCVLTYLLARELLPESASRWTAVLAAIYFPHIYFATLLLSENLFVPLLAATGWMFLRHLRTGSYVVIAIAGMCLGASCLTRPFALLLVPILLLVLAAHVWRQRATRGWAAAAVMLVCTAAVVGPWTLRNERVHGHTVLVATNGGSTFYGGNNDKVAALSSAIGTWVSTRSLPGRADIDATPNEITHDKLEWRLGINWVQDHAARLPMLLTAKAIRLFLPDMDSANRRYVLLNLIGYTPFLVLMLIGFARCIRERSLRTLPWMLVHGIMVATLLTALIFWGSPRFRDANMPVLMLYAVLGLSKGYVSAARDEQRQDPSMPNPSRPTR